MDEGFDELERVVCLWGSKLKDPFNLSLPLILFVGTSFELNFSIFFMIVRFLSKG